MKAAMHRARYVLIVLTALSLLLAGVLLWEWEQGVELRGELMKLRKLPVTPIPPQKVLAEFSLLKVEAGFPELLARPIFSVNRLAYTTAAQADAGAMKKGQFVLVGVIVSPGQRSALLRDAITGKTERLAQTGVARGMTLSQVLPGRVVLRQGDESEELFLNAQRGPKSVQSSQAAMSPAVPVAATGASSSRPPASAAIPAATAGVPSASVPGVPAIPRPSTAPELILAEKQRQTALEQVKRQLPPVPPAPPSVAPK